MPADVAKKAQSGLEQRLGSLQDARPAALRPARGWLRAVRDAVGLSQEGVAKKLRVKRQSYAQLETAEEHNAISLGSLRRAAEAMDCELVYFIVPREAIARTYRELSQIHDPALKCSPAEQRATVALEKAAAEVETQENLPVTLR